MAAPATLAAALVGQRIARIETEVASRDGLAIEIGFDSGDVAQITVAPRGGPYADETGIRAALRWRFVAKSARHRARPCVTPKYHPGDGSEDQQRLSELLVGRTIRAVRDGAVTAEGYTVTRLDLERGMVLVSPLRLAGAWLVALIVPKQDRRMLLAGRGFLES